MDFFSLGMDAGMRVSMLSRPQAPLSMGFPRQEYWSGLQFPSPGDVSDPGIEPDSPALAGGFFMTESPGKPLGMDIIRWLCYPLHNDNLGCPRADRVSDTGHQFSATHAITNFFPVSKDFTIFFLLQTFLKLIAQLNSITTTNLFLGF